MLNKLLDEQCLTHTTLNWEDTGRPFCHPEFSLSGKNYLVSTYNVLDTLFKM